MLKQLEALKNYIVESGLDFRTVEQYSSHFKMSKTDLKLIEVNGKLPSCLIIIGASKPIASPPVFEFDLFITTKNDAFDAAKNLNANIELVSALLKYIEDNNTFSYEINVSEEDNYFFGEYSIDTETVSAIPFLVSDAYAIFLLHIAFEQLS